MKLIKLKRRKPNRSVGGDIGIYILLILFGIFFVLPLVYSISSAFKPLDEIYLYLPVMSLTRYLLHCLVR